MHPFPLKLLRLLKKIFYTNTHTHTHTHMHTHKHLQYGICVKCLFEPVYMILYNGYRVFPGGKAAGVWC